MLLSMKIIFITLLHMNFVICAEEETYTFFVNIAGVVPYPKDICGGALITFEHVMSSLHCIQHLFMKHKDVKMTAGYGRSKTPEQTRDAANFIMSSTSDDMVLVKAVYPFQQSSFVDLAHLPKKNEELCAVPKILEIVLVSSNSSSASGQFLLGYITWFAKAEDCVLRDQTKTSCTAISNRKCTKNTAWPLICDNTVVGIETGCQRPGGGRSDETITTYAHVDKNLDFLAEATGKHNITTSKETAKKRAKNTARFLHGGNEIVWKEILLILAAVLRVD